VSKLSDAEFMQQLKFAEESDAELEQLSGEKLKDFIAEYKRVVEIARRVTSSSHQPTSPALSRITVDL